MLPVHREVLQNAQVLMIVFQLCCLSKVKLTLIKWVLNYFCSSVSNKFAHSTILCKLNLKNAQTQIEDLRTSLSEAGTEISSLNSKCDSQIIVFQELQDQISKKDANIESLESQMSVLQLQAKQYSFEKEDFEIRVNQVIHFMIYP